MLVTPDRIYRQLGREPEAVRALEESLALARRIDHREAEGYALAYLGLVCAQAGQHRSAKRLLLDALCIAATVAS